MIDAPRAASPLLAMFTSLAAVLAPSVARAAPEVTLWHSYRGAERVAFEKVAADLSSRPGALYALQLLAVPHDAFPRKLAAAIPRGHGPDLFVFAQERIGEWARAGRLASVAAEEAPEPRDFVAGTVDALRFDGKLWGHPLAFKSLALYHRTDLEPVAPRTTDELLARAKARTDPAAGRYGLAYEAGSIYHHAPWLHAFGGAMFDGDRPGLGSPGAIAAMEYVRHLARDLEVVPRDSASSVVAMLFNDGRAAFAINGPWFLGEVRPGVPFAVAPLPIVSETGKPAAPFLTVEAVLQSARAKEPALARLAARDLAAAPSALVRALLGRQAVAHTAAWDDPRVKGDPILSAFRAQARFAVQLPNRPEMNVLWEPAAVALRQVLRGHKSPASAARAAQRRAEHLLRPAPPAADPTPYAAVLGALMLAAAIWFVLRARRRMTEVRRSGRAYRYLAPAAIALLVLVVFPTVFGVVLAFFEHRAGEYTFVGLSNFWEILASKEYGLGEAWNFYTTFAVTVLWTAINVALHLALGVALALWLSRPWLKMRGLFRVLLILPWAVPSYITALLWKGMFNAQFGAVNELLAFFGVEPVSWFASFWPAFSANVVTNAWLGFPFMMVVTLGALQAIPSELNEAAAVDGATAWQRFRKITVPLLRPALGPAVVLGTVWTFNMFNVVWLVSGGEPDGMTDIMVSEAYRWAFARGERYGYAAAYALLIFFILFAYSFVTGRMRGPAWTADPKVSAR